MDVEIRTASVDDARGLKGIESAVARDEGRGGLIEGWLREDVVLVAEREGTVVGYGVFNHGFFRQGWVEMLMIDPRPCRGRRGCRGQGVGGVLLAELERVCEMERLFVTTNESNERMRRLLRRRGYREVGCIHELDPGDPELVFVRDL